MATGDLQRSLFDQTNLAEIRSPEFPGERLMACYNPLSADDAVRNYKRLAEVEQAFRSLKSIDLLVRPIHHRTANDFPVHSFGTLLAELATRCRHTCVPAGGLAEATFTKLTDATPLQIEAFRLLGLKPASH